MVHLATEFCICLSLIIIVCTLVCLAESGKCPRERVHKPLCYDACNSLKGSYSSYLSSYYGSGHQKTGPINVNSRRMSELVRFPSMLYGFRSEAQCSRAGNLDINRSDSGHALPKQSFRSDGNVSWSSDDVVFHLPDGKIITCSLNFRESDLEKLPPSVNVADQIVLSSCREHLLSMKETSFSLRNIEIQKATSSHSSSPCVNIGPSKLIWEQNYLYHSSVASLRLKNTCNESVLTVYEIFSTDSQFYPFNFSEIVLDPGEVTTISFAYLPNRLGLSSAQLVLLTSSGGFLVEAKGFAVESPYRLRPLLVLDASSGGWLSRKLSLSNPFDETIDLEEVSALISVFESSGSLIVESICRKQNPKDSNKHKFSNIDRKLLESMDMEVRPLSSWFISPHRTQRILEMAFSPDLKGKVVGAICMELLRPLEGEKDMLVVPFEAELHKTITSNDTTPLSVSIDAVGPCDASETTLSVSVRNHASDLLKIVKINEIIDGKKLLQIKYLEGLLLFPSSITQVALVTYETSNVKYDSFLEMPDVSINCKLEIWVNDSISPLLEVPCLEFFGICPRQEQESVSHMLDIVDPSNRLESLISTKKSPILSKALGGVVADEIVPESWRAQSTKSGLYLLDNHELVFPRVPIGEYYAKSITVKNPSQQPVIVQLILNSGVTIGNCGTCYGHQQSPSSSSICNDSTGKSTYGFSIADSAVTEAFVHPHGTISLGPILFHPSNRCEWKSSAFTRSNLSGLELLSLRGFGGSLSLIMLEGSEFMQRLDFNMNLPFSLNTSNIEDVSFHCHKPLLKKLFAVNAGDFPVKVKRICVSGRECGLDGFVVHNCRGFSLEPGESMELGLSYQSDFSVPLVQRELELILAVGILVIPMQGSLPLNMLNICAKSIFWSRVKKYCGAIVVGAVFISLLFWFIMLSVSMTKGRYPENDKVMNPFKSGHVKQGITAEHTDQSVDCRTEVAVQPVCLTVKTRKEKRRRSRKRNALIEVSSSQSGNSTPSSPLSPITTLSPPETCSPSLEKTQPHDSFCPESVSSASVPEKQNQESSGGSRKTGSRAILLPSTTGTRNSPSRLAMGPHARAPGPKIQPSKPVQPEESSQAEDDGFTYDIWGNHFSGIHLCRPNSSYTITSGTIGHSNSFFLRGPRQILMSNPQPPYVSSFCDDG